MIDRLFTTLLTLAVLSGGTLAIGSELFAPRLGVAAVADARIATLPRVVITGSRQHADTTLAQAAAPGTQGSTAPIAQ
jgi:hypothetical protein